jgi:hypothetical protein
MKLEAVNRGKKVSYTQEKNIYIQLRRPNNPGKLVHSPR